jgi:electron transfer flavoprotein alpha subunit
MVLVFIDSHEGHIKKASLEAMCYAAKHAEQAGTTAEGVVLGKVSEDLTSLGRYGMKKIHHADSDSFNSFDAREYSQAIAELTGKIGAKVIVFANNADGKAIAPRLSVRLKAGLVAGAVALPETGNGFIIRKNVFSGKAFANVSVTSDIKIISLNPNSYPITETGDKAEIAKFDYQPGQAKIKVVSENKASGEVPLTEAEIVVSAGRGMKGPENWGIVEDLAHSLHAALACSRPVADAHWRPHNEHVGQTGIAIAPNLYIAIGISGAIQHLAGVNRSKVIVVINKDPEAPFFKAADYGIVGDAFEIVPRLTAAIKKIKN